MFKHCTHLPFPYVKDHLKHGEWREAALAFVIWFTSLGDIRWLPLRVRSWLWMKYEG